MLINQMLGEVIAKERMETIQRQFEHKRLVEQSKITQKRRGRPSPLMRIISGLMIHFKFMS